MNVVAIIQARMGSSRLPGKVLLPLEGCSVLERVVDRVSLCPLIDEVMIASTISSADDILEDEARKLLVTIYRGSEADVLSRYYEAAKLAKADVVIRITSDCPLIDPDVLESMLSKYFLLIKQGSQVDYLSNTIVRSFPRGLDAEIFPFEILKKINESAKLQHEREHVTPYIYQNPENFSIYDYKCEKDLSKFRWTLDTKADYELLARIFSLLKGKTISLDTVLSLFDAYPELANINAHIEQKKLTD